MFHLFCNLLQHFVALFFTLFIVPMPCMNLDGITKFYASSVVTTTYWVIRHNLWKRHQALDSTLPRTSFRQHSLERHGRKIGTIIWARHQTSRAARHEYYECRKVSMSPVVACGLIASRLCSFRFVASACILNALLQHRQVRHK